MDILEAHGRLALVERGERDRLIPDAGLVQTPGGPCDVWPAVATALASLSGGLDDAETDDELAESVRHGLSLWRAEIVSDDAVCSEVDAVISAVNEWGEANDMAVSTSRPANG
jgi:hypothetical protein